MSTTANRHQIKVIKDGTTHNLDVSQLHTLTGARFAPHLEFSNFRLLRKAATCKKEPLTADRLWLAAYFRREILHHTLPAVSLRWIDNKMGWGVFAEKDFGPMEFIAEYTGIVRKRGKSDSKNAYCFEYPLNLGSETSYLIDAAEQGGLSRYMNHSNQPNLYSAYTLIDSVPHIVLYTAKQITKGTELRYDYGPDYWTKRPSPETG